MNKRTKSKHVYSVIRGGVMSHVTGPSEEVSALGRI